MIAPAYWGCGYAKSIVTLALEEIVARLGPQRVVAVADSENAASISALTWCGFTEAERRETMLKFQPSVDVIFHRCIYPHGNSVCCSSVPK